MENGYDWVVLDNVRYTGHQTIAKDKPVSSLEFEMATDRNVPSRGVIWLRAKCLPS